MTNEEVTHYAHHFLGSERRIAPKFHTFRGYRIITEDSTYGREYRKEERKREGCWGCKFCTISNCNPKACACHIVIKKTRN